MSWKLSIVAIGLIGLIASGVAVAVRGVPWECPGARSDTHTVVSHGAGPQAAAGLSDREQIEKQKTCPVTDEPLGSMGKPVKVGLKDRTVFLCCAGCKDTLLADPDKYLKKLDEKQGETK